MQGLSESKLIINHILSDYTPGYKYIYLFIPELFALHYGIPAVHSGIAFLFEFDWNEVLQQTAH